MTQRFGLFAVLVLYASQFVMVDFGKINPFPLGVISCLAITSVSCLIAFLVGRYSHRLFVCYVVFSSLLLWVVVVSNWWYSQYFQTYYSYELLSFGRDILLGGKAASGLLHKDRAVLLFSVMAFAAALSIRTYSKPVYRGRGVTALILVLGVGASVGFWVTHSSYHNYKRLGLLQLTPSFFHPLHAFFYGTPNPPPQKEKREIVRYFTTLNKPVEEDFRVSSKLGVDSYRYNVIVVVMESVRADMIGFYGSSENLTPNIDSMAEELIVAKNFYANTNYTMKGELAIWCGVLDARFSPVSYSEDSFNSETCLPRVLKKLDYTSYYYHANKGAFYNRKEFLPKLGFDYLFFEKDQRESEVEYLDIGWGIDDAYMYERVLDDMVSHNAQSDNPFFASFMTISSHYPFTWSWGVETPNEVVPNVRNGEELYRNYENAVYYQDYVLGQFWINFKRSALYHNTILVITSDHGVWTFPDEHAMNNAEKNERFFRAPLLIYHPSIKKALRVDQVASQIDLAPTLLNFLGLEENEKHLGKNIFQKVESPWSVMIKQGETLVRIKDALCFVDNEKCSGIHQNCVATEFFGPLVDLSENRMCRDVSGDMLKGGRATDSLQSPSIIDYAIDLVRHHSYSRS